MAINERVLIVSSKTEERLSLWMKNNLEPGETVDEAINVLIGRKS